MGFGRWPVQCSVRDVQSVGSEKGWRGGREERSGGERGKEIRDVSDAGGKKKGEKQRRIGREGRSWREGAGGGEPLTHCGRE